MKYIRNKTLLAIVAAAVLMLCGCTEEQPLPTDNNNGTQLETVSVTLPLTVAPVEDGTPSSRTIAHKANNAGSFTVSFGKEATATTADANAGSTSPATRALESEVKNVWVLQFNESGANVFTQMVATELAAGTPITIPALAVGTGYTIYVLANVPSTGFSTSAPATLAEWETQLLCTNDIIKGLPMIGKLTNVRVTKLENGNGALLLNDASPAVVLRRIYAEVNITLDLADFFTANNTYKLNTVQLYNTTIGASYGWNAQTSTSPSFPENPDNTIINFTDFLDINGYPLYGMSSDNETVDDINLKVTKQWFVAENRRGDVAGISDQSHRSSLHAPDYATFARINLYTNNGDEIFLDIYLGSGKLSNFDLVRNHVYNINVAISGGDSFLESLIGVDQRVSGTSKKIPVYLTYNKDDSPIEIMSARVDNRLFNTSWGPSRGSVLATDVYDGKKNTDAIGNNSDYLPIQYCYNSGNGWYLPAQAQLMLMWIYASAFPVGEIMSHESTNTGVEYWSSTQLSTDPLKVFNANFMHGASTYYYGDNYTRCVKNGKHSTFGSWKYPRVESGHTIVSSDSKGGIKADALLNENAKTTLKNEPNSPLYGTNDMYNKVSAKFRVATKWANSGGMVYQYTHNTCKNYYETDAPAGTWRMPTQRELSLMWIFRGQLTAATGLGGTTASLWSISTDSGTPANAYMVDFKTGESKSIDRLMTYYVRCVRDL